MGRLDGRAAVIVGVASVIGKACASAFAAEGAEVLAVDPDHSAAEEVARSVTAAGGSVEPYRAAYHGVDTISVAQTCEARWGRLDVLLNCTALLDYWDPDEPSIEGWETILHANLLGPVSYTLALRSLLERSACGSVIFLSSIDGLLGNPDFPAYSASKGGLIPFTHVMAHDLGRHGVRVNCLAMAGMVPVGTGPAPRLPASSLADTVLRTPLARVPRPDELASVAVFLASDEASYVNGVVIPVDGGRIGVTPGTGFHASG
jgi:3-oxoacyl-[acyl-carrier protein] reductase